MSGRLAALLVMLLLMGSAAGAGIVVDAGKPGPKLSPMHYGIFFEEINHAGDGGLWAEMIRNRSFEDAATPDGWQTIGTNGEIAIDDSEPLNALNTHSLRVTAKGERFGVANPGYWRLPIVKGKTYNCALIARCADDFSGRLSVCLEGASGETYASKSIGTLTANWRKFEFRLKPSESDPAALLTITADQPGVFWLDFVSLMPSDAKNGFRPDLLAMLKDLNPGFVRFPGGCYVEGGDFLADAWRWKLALGPQETRRTHQNLWGYRTTNALGLHEYLVLCEMLGAEPLLVVNCGMAHKENAPMDKLGDQTTMLGMELDSIPQASGRGDGVQLHPQHRGLIGEWIADALDAIEYANGSPSTTWGARRAAAGHPKPFGLKYLEIGNENSGPAYEERYAAFYDAIKAKYPQMHLIADTLVKSRPVEITDDHYYSSPDFFMNAAGFYDSYKRGDNKVYVGEYAVVSGCGQGNLRAALGEASFMIGMERNADVVTMTSYAPLFVNVNDRRWNPNLIPFDADRSFGTPSYYVQKLFAHNRGDVVLPSVTDGPVRRGAITGGVGVGTWLTAAEFTDIKVTGASLPALSRWKPSAGEWSIDGGILKQSSLDADCRYTDYNTKWQDYTLSLRARKLSGAEGFLIMFRARDKGNWFWWNIGGWGNVASGVERCDAGGKTPATPQVPLAVETGRWYDIRVVLSGPRLRCYLDGELIHDFTVADTSLVSAIAVRDGDDIILKVVNGSDEPWDAPISIENLGWKSARVHLTVLTAPSPDDENSFDDPEMIHPVDQDLGSIRLPFRHTMPAYSLSILRLRK